MDVKSAILEINSSLNKHIDKKFKEGGINFFKEEINPLGVRTPIVKKIASQFYAEHKKEFSKNDWLELCETLWKEKINDKSVPCFEYGVVIIYLLKKQIGNLEKKDFYLFEKWIDKYITNWAHCDGFCSWLVGEVIRKHPELSQETLKWTSSKNRWKKRASAVCYIKLSEEKKFLPIIFKTSRRLINDTDDLVQKGYGWSLKDASYFHKKEVIEFLMQNKNLPRTALRYACERLTKEEKKTILN